ncbi:hypothetical protein LJC46_00775 [Desulfovibrio sp. OttesenSCG-928-G15]|nr:hypothetical protein [Desulfovibrio sp. OttesenSCG-928-G15]
MNEQKQASGEDAATAAPSPSLSEKQRRELWLYIAVSIAAVELLIAMGSFLYAFITASPATSNAPTSITVPWVAWGAMALIAPTLILLIVHVADVGLFRAPGGAASEQEWQKLLPDRLQTLYRFIKGAPVVVVLVGLVALGGVLLTLDGAFAVLAGLGAVLLPHLPWIIAGVAVLGCVLVIAVVWLNYRTRRLIAEYDFRREVLEKTGVIIVDKGSTPLPPGGISDVPYALVAGEEEQAALPPAPESGQADTHVTGIDNNTATDSATRDNAVADGEVNGTMHDIADQKTG